MSDDTIEKKSERPYAFAIFSVVIAIGLSFGLVLWASSSPEMVLVGEPGIHDAHGDDVRLAGCLDCHVPFIGTPGSRCLSPSCHGALATGTPPKTGPAMPIRFHATLATLECNQCHQEHGEKQQRANEKFDHKIIPEAQGKQCNRCHSGAQQKSHASTDAIQCDQCHDIENWRTESMDHQRIFVHACDVCHVAPETATHGSVAGTCSTCHETQSWAPKETTP